MEEEWMGRGIDGQGEGMKGEEGEENGWYGKINKKMLNKII